MSSLTSNALLAPVMPAGAHASTVRWRRVIGRTHGGTEATIHLEHCELAQVVVAQGFCEVGVGHNLIFSGRSDAIPVKVLSFCTFVKVPSEEIEEGLHLCIECLLSERIYDGVDELAHLVAHCLGRDTGGSGLEVDMACTTDTGIEGVASGIVG
jgi:hypothetical protein